MDITSALNNKQLRFSVLEGIACLWSWCSAFISQMRCLHSSCAILSTMAMLCWCRTPAAGSWREATSTRSCCSTPWVAGPRMMTCPWTGGWNNMQLCSKKRFLIPSQPLLPSSRLPCYMLAPQRWAVPWTGLWDSQVQGQVSEKQEHFWDSSLWADSDIFWSLYLIWLFPYRICGASLVAQSLPAMQETHVPGSGRSPGEGNGNPLQYSCLENSMDRGVWRATVHGVAKSWTWLSH